MVRAAGPLQPRIPEATGKDCLSNHRPQGQYRQAIVGREQLFSSLGLSLPIVKGAV